jgi:large repetitive protein
VKNYISFISSESRVISIGFGIITILMLSFMASGSWARLLVAYANDDATDLSLTKTASSANVLVGEVFTYTLTVQNQGPLNAPDVLLTDDLPSQVTLISVFPEDICTGQTTVECDLGEMPVDAMTEVTLTVEAVSTGTAANSAEASSSAPDPDLENNTASAEVTISPRYADLSVTKTASSAEVLVGDVFTYTITVENLGPYEAPETVLTDALPVEVSYISAVSDKGSCQKDSLLNCSLGELLPNASATITVTVEAITAGIASNEAVVASAAPDPTLGNNTASSNVTIDERYADLSVTKTASSSEVVVGDMFTYTVIVENLGPYEASETVLTDTLPLEVSLISVMPDEICSGAPSVVCDLGELSHNDTVTITLTVEAISAASEVTNIATVSSTSPDPEVENNTASAEVTISPRYADLSVTKSASSANVYVGDEFTYTMIVENLGPYEAYGTVLTDTLPVEVGFVSAVTEQGNCDGNSLLSCSLDELSPNASATITLTVEAKAVGTVTNTVNVISDDPDPNPENNSASTMVTIEDHKANLSVEIADFPAQVTAGTSFSYTLRVHNAGPHAAVNTVLENILPEGVSLPTFNPGPYDCSESGLIITCNLGDLQTGPSIEPVEIPLSVYVLPSTTGSLLIQASVDSNTGDPEPGNNMAQVPTTVQTSADLSIVKTASVDSIYPGDVFTYTITVHNDGPSDAVEVQVSDTLPDGINLKTATTSKGSCTQISPVICDLDNLPVNETWIITIAVEVDDGASPGDKINDAHVASEITDDPDPQNNQDAETVTLIPQADLQVSLAVLPDPVTAGGVLSLIATIENKGPSQSEAVALTIQLPAESSFKSSVPGEPTCTLSGGALICSIGLLEPAAKTQVSLDITIDEDFPGGEISITAAASAATLDPVSGNDTVTRFVQVRPAPIDDKEPPVVTWIAPQVNFDNRYDVYGMPVLLKVEATDNIGIEYVYFFRWDAIANDFEAIKILAVGPYEYLFDTTVLNFTWNSIGVIAVDTSGNASEIQWIWLYRLYPIFIPVLLH